MATIRKPTFSVPIPLEAKILTKDGKRFAQFTRNGKRVLSPLTKDGSKCRIESEFWYVRYKDRDGKWKEVKNEELWRELDKLLARHRVRVTHVRGHSGHPENERCDTLAVAAYQKYLK